MKEPQYWAIPQEEGYYIMFSPYADGDYDYEAVYIEGEPGDWTAHLPIGAQWPIRGREEHVWYYGPIPKPEEAR